MKGDRRKERVGMEGVEGDEEKRREQRRREAGRRALTALSCVCYMHSTDEDRLGSTAVH